MWPKVLLVYPPDGAASRILETASLEPLALEYIAAALPGARVEILDMRIDGQLERALRRTRADMVGFTAYTCHVNTVKEMAAIVKKTLPRADVIIGGHHATVRPADFDMPVVDYIIGGEGCSAISELAFSKKEKKDILGLAYLRDGQRCYNPPRPHPELDGMPLPRRDLTRKYKGHYYYGWHNPATSVRTSLGCLHRCHFCPLWGITGGKYLKRSVVSLLAEIEGIEGRFIFFDDDESMADRDRMETLARAIISSGLRKRFHAYARVDTIVSNPYLFRLWKEAGLRSVSVGYESGDDRRLGRMNKKMASSAQTRATDILKGCGIEIDALFIIEPDYIQSDFLAVADHVRQLKLWRPSYSIMTPVPGTPLYEEKKGLLTSDNWDLYDMAHAVLPTALPPETFYGYFTQLSRTARIELRALSMLRLPLSLVWERMSKSVRPMELFKRIRQWG